jgi:hypothetical protein
MSEMNEFFGVPGASEGKKEYIKARRIGIGEDVAGRIIPPIKSQKATGKWKVYHRIHWGYSVPNAKDSKGKAWVRPFLCIKKDDMRTGMVIQACPKCDQIAEKEAAQKAREAEIRTKLGAKAEEKKVLFEALKADEIYSTLSDWLKLHNAESGYYINLKYIDGSCGTLVMKSSLNKSLDEVITKFAAKETGGDKAKATQILMDPAGGWYLQFSRNEGKGNETKYTASFYLKEIVGDDGDTVSKKVKAPLTADDITKITAGCLDLNEAHGATILNEAQIRQLIECDEDPETVKAIMDAAQKRDPGSPSKEKSAPATTPAPKGDSAKALAAETVKAAKKAAPKTVSADEEDALLKGFADEA